MPRVDSRPPEPPPRSPAATGAVSVTVGSHGCPPRVREQDAETSPARSSAARARRGTPVSFESSRRPRIRSIGLRPALTSGRSSRRAPVRPLRMLLEYVPDRQRGPLGRSAGEDLFVSGCLRSGQDARGRVRQRFDDHLTRTRVVCDPALPFDRCVRITSPTAVTRSASVSVLPLPCARTGSVGVDAAAEVEVRAGEELEVVLREDAELKHREPRRSAAAAHPHFGAAPRPRGDRDVVGRDDAANP